jgi:hypothetical protein
MMINGGRDGEFVVDKPDGAIEAGCNKTKASEKSGGTPPL